MTSGNMDENSKEREKVVLHSEGKEVLGIRRKVVSCNMDKNSKRWGKE